MTLQQVLTALDVLQEYPELREYIKDFDGQYGFTYTIETQPERVQLQKQMEQVLDDDNHSGNSWGYMLRTIQSVFTGVISRDELVERNKAEQIVLAEVLEEHKRNMAAMVAGTGTEQTS